MCMATLVPSGVEIPWKGLRNGAETNNDGHGFAIASKEHGIEVFKSMEYEETFEALRLAREKHGISSIVVFHSRWGTHGEMGEFNIHPFWVGGEDGPKDTIMVHNGILPSAYHPARGEMISPGHYAPDSVGEDGKKIKGKWITGIYGKGDRRSDTRIFVDQVTEEYCNSPLGVPSARSSKRLGTLIGTGNKLVFLSVKGGVPKAKIVNAHCGEFTDGVWYSNSGYKFSCSYNQGSFGVGSRSYARGDWWGDEDFVSTRASGTEECPLCKNDEVSLDGRVCDICSYCLDCEVSYTDCMCFYAGAEKLCGDDDFATLEDELFQRWCDKEISDEDYDEAWEDLYAKTRAGLKDKGEPHRVVDLFSHQSSGKELVRVGVRVGVSAFDAAIEKHGEVVVVEDDWVRFEDGTWIPEDRLL